MLHGHDLVSRRGFRVMLILLVTACMPLCVWAQEQPVTAFPAHVPRVAPAQKSGGPAPANSDAFDVTYYHLTLDLAQTRSPLLVGRVRIEGVARSVLRTLEFDLSNLLSVSFVISSEGTVLPWEHRTDRVFVQLPETLQAGDFYALDLVYEGDPQGTGFGSFESIRNDAVYPDIMWTLSEPYGAKDWWPSDDHPSDKADSVRITVTVPKPFTVGSNGVLISESDLPNGSTKFDWLHRYPISTYLVFLAIADYDRTTEQYDRPDDLANRYGPATFPIVHFSFAGSNAYQGISSTSGWRLAKEMMPVYEDWFGPYPFEEEKYGHAHFPIRGGMEHQTMSSMGNIGAELIAHELTHQWYGDKLTAKSWPHLWLNEGFATFGEFVVFDSDPKYRALGNLLKDLYYERSKYAAGTLVLSDTSNVNSMFNFANVYAKGWMVLRMINGMVGDAVMKDIMRTYATLPKHAYGIVESADFQAVVEQVTGRSFDTFFDQWVYSGTGYPVYQAEVMDVGINGNYRARITLRQVQETDDSAVHIFEMPVWLELKTADKTLLLNVENDLREQVYEIDVDSAPISVRVDPENWILKDVSFKSTDRATFGEIPTTLNVKAFPNPARDMIRFEIDNGSLRSQADVEMLNALGQLVGNKTVQLIPNGLSGHVLQFGNVPPGLYLLRVRSGPRIVDRTLIVSGN